MSVQYDVVVQILLVFGLNIVILYVILVVSGEWWVVSGDSGGGGDCDCCCEDDGDNNDNCDCVVGGYSQSSVCVFKYFFIK